jgi:UDP-glucose 4-epimerase
MVKTWLITGGNGFVGTNLRAEILFKYPKHRVLVVDTRNYNKDFTDRAKVFRISVANSRSMAKIFDKYRPDYIVHLAAKTGVRDSIVNPKYCIEQNILGTLNCLDLARKYNADSVVIASSCGVAGEQFGMINEDTHCSPISPYATSKVCTEDLGNCYSKLGVNVCILRFSNMFGPWSDHKESVVTSFVKAFINKEPMRVNGTGRQTRNFLYIKDAIKAILLCVQKGAVGTYCIAGDRSISINDLISLICDVGGNNAETVFDDAVDGEIIDINIDNSKARRGLMFQCEHSTMNGISETMKWFRRLKSGTL